jgi:hypothetical protein
MLLGALSVEEVKEFVPDNWPAQPPAVLGTLNRLRQPGRRGQRCGQRAVAEKAEGLAMNFICA